MTLSVTPTNDPLTLVNEITSAGIMPFNLSYTGGTLSSGTFTNGLSAGLGFDRGIILTNGLATNAVGSNGNGYEAEMSGLGNPNPEIADGASTALGLPGDTELSNLVGYNTFDATALQFDFISPGGNGEFQYIFASEEYIDFENTNFNDVFAFFLDGQNIALLPGSNIPVSINTVNSVENQVYFQQNISPALFDIEYDGFTVALTAQLNNLTPGVHTLKLTIADGSDGSLDSAILIKSQSFNLTPIPDPSLSPLSWLAIAILCVASSLKAVKKS